MLCHDGNSYDLASGAELYKLDSMTFDPVNAALGRTQVFPPSLQPSCDRRGNYHGLGARLRKHVFWICMAAKEAGLLEIRTN